MIALLLSDTHVSGMDGLDKRLIDEIERADLVIHAGDYTGIALVEDLRSSNEFYGVYGNMDPYEVRSVLKPSIVLELEGIRIGVIHPPGGGPPFGIKGRILKMVGKVDVVVYGHTHIPSKCVKEGILMVNPGSATRAFPALRRSYCLLELKGGEVVSADLLKI